jgi:hypothetical protein
VDVDEGSSPPGLDLHCMGSFGFPEGRSISMIRNLLLINEKKKRITL